MKRLSFLILITLCLSCKGPQLYDGFVSPPKEERPWCYYLAFNGHFDKKT